MKTNLELPTKIHKRLRIQGINENRTISEIATDAIAAYLDSKEAESLDPASIAIADDDSTKSVEFAAAC